jgi:hypothetical protein
VSIIESLSRARGTAALLGCAWLAACGGSDPSVGSQDITFDIQVVRQVPVVQGGRTSTAVQVVDIDPEDTRKLPDERAAFDAAVSMRLVDPMPPGVGADIAPGALTPGTPGALEVRASDDAQAGRHQLVVAGTLGGGSSTTRYVAHTIEVQGLCAAGTESIVEVAPSRVARTLAWTRSGALYAWGHNSGPDLPFPDAPPPVPRTLAFYTAQPVPEVGAVRSAASADGVSLVVLQDSGALSVLVRHHRSDVRAPGGRSGWHVHDVAGASGFVQAVARDSGFYVLHEDGTVWQLESSIDERGSFLTPTLSQVPGFADVTLLAAGTQHLLARRRDGTVLAMGSNDFGQIGDGTTGAALEPIPVPGLTDIIRVAAGDEHSLALRANGGVLAWGRGDSGQIGDGFRVDVLRPLAVLSAGGNVITNVIDVSAGRAHSVLHLTGGEVLAWGRASEGQLGQGTNDALHPRLVDNNPADRVFAAADSTLRVRFAQGTVQGWGANTDGLLGDGTTTPRSTPVFTLGLGRGEQRDCRAEAPGGD